MREKVLYKVLCFAVPPLLATEPTDSVPREPTQGPVIAVIHTERGAVAGGCERGCLWALRPEYERMDR